MELVPGRVMVFGTFDILHKGHRYFIDAARRQGKELVIVVARDANVLRFKEDLLHHEVQRLEALQEAYPEVVVVYGNEVHPLAVIERYKPELVCLGYDQIGFSQELMDEYPQVKIKRIDAYHPEKYKSSIMKQQLEKKLKKP